MKKYLLIILCFLFFACSEDRKEENRVKDTVENFYKCINDRNFKTMETIISPNMYSTLIIMKNISSDIVFYKKYKVKDIVISGDKAKVNVECVDNFDNKINCLWDLVKINNIWKMNNFNFSYAEQEQENVNVQEKEKIPYNKILKENSNNIKIDTIK